MNLNLKCEDLKQEIINLINSSDLPLSLVYYMFQNLSIEIQSLYMNTLRQERKKEQEQNKENSNQNKE